MKKNNIQKIYEQKGVYGSEAKFMLSKDRLSKMIFFIKNLKFTPRRILDVGCGTGFFANKMGSIFPGSEIYGFDISNEAISCGRKKYSKIKFIVGDAEKKFPFKSNFFDLIISGEHIEHLRDVDIYLHEINRVLSKNGKLILTTPNLVSWLNRILLFFGKWPFYLGPSLRVTFPILSFFNYSFPDRNLPPSGHLRLFTKEMLEKLLAVYKLGVAKFYGVSYFNKPIIKQIDRLISIFPTLSSGLIVIAEKKGK